MASSGRLGWVSIPKTCSCAASCETPTDSITGQKERAIRQRQGNVNCSELMPLHLDLAVRSETRVAAAGHPSSGTDVLKSPTIHKIGQQSWSPSGASQSRACWCTHGVLAGARRVATPVEWPGQSQLEGQLQHAEARGHDHGQHGPHWHGSTDAGTFRTDTCTRPYII